MSMVQPLIGWVGIASLVGAASYAILAFFATLVWQSRSATASSRRSPAVTVLMPLCGAQPNLYERLRLFCQQNHSEYQIVFGVRDLTDPALPLVERLMAEFPSLPIDCVVNPQQHGSIRKIRDLMAMLPRARHDVLSIADSNLIVGQDYLATVSAPLLDHKVGLVTCLYRGVPTQEICSRLSAMSINEWYVPSMLFARLFGYRSYISCHSLCVRRTALQSIGGRQASAIPLTLESWLRKLIRELGQRVVLSPYVLKMQRQAPNLESLARQQLHWMRRIRALQPCSFPFLFITFTSPVALLGIALSATQPVLFTFAEALFQTTILVRLALHFANRLRGDRPGVHEFWLLPLQDFLMVWAWGRAVLTLRLNSGAATRELPRAPTATIPFGRE
jgi:ceramide glucosyltransferase